MIENILENITYIEPDITLLVPDGMCKDCLELQLHEMCDDCKEYVTEII
jgi:hypothetical protein